MTAAKDPPELIPGAVRWHREGPDDIVLVLERPLHPTQLPELTAKVGVILASTGASHLVCDVGAITAPCAVLIDALARLQLVARRAGSSLRLRNTHDDVKALMALTGIRDVLQTRPPPSRRDGKADRTSGTSSPYRGTR